MSHSSRRLLSTSMNGHSRGCATGHSSLENLLRVNTLSTTLQKNCFVNMKIKQWCIQKQVRIRKKDRKSDESISNLRVKFKQTKTTELQSLEEERKDRKDEINKNIFSDRIGSIGQ